MASEKRFVVLKRLQGVNKGVKFWTMNTGDNVGHKDGEPLHEEVMFTDDASEAIKECSKTDNDDRKEEQ